MENLHNIIDRMGNTIVGNEPPPCDKPDGKCEDCGEVTEPSYFAGFIGNRKDAGWRDARSVCDSCSRIRRHKKERAMRVETILSHSGLKPIHQDMTLDNFDKVPKQITEYDGGANLIIHGQVGTGKTHLVVGLIKNIITENVIVVKFITGVQLLHKIRNSLNGEPYKSDTLIDSYSKYPLLVIDDLGAEKSTEWTKETLYLIIDNRYCNMLPTIVTSNLTPGELSSKLDDRMISRLMSNAVVVKLTGKDRRLSK